MKKDTRPFKILSLDGGGARGIYSLGVLTELEAMVGAPLHQEFDLIYGTSTGAIIGALIAIGKSAQEISDLYLDWIPDVFSANSAHSRSRSLRAKGEEIFRNLRFDAFRTMVGFVTTDCDHERPRIFKNSATQSFSRLSTFEPGFGASILDAVMASAAAVPYFEQVRVKTSNQGTPLLMDGGFVANNPTIFAITDAMGSLGVSEKNIRVLNIGTGKFSEPKPNILERAKMKIANGFLPASSLMKSLNANSNSVDWLAGNLFVKLQKLRIDGARPDLEVGILCNDYDVLVRAHTFGRDSFGTSEIAVKKLLSS